MSLMPVNCLPVACKPVLCSIRNQQMRYLGFSALAVKVLKQRNVILKKRKYMTHFVTNEITCAPRDDSGQPGHPPKLIPIFFVHMKIHYSLLRPFLCFTINQFAQKFKCLANLNRYFVHICYIY